MARTEFRWASKGFDNGLDGPVWSPDGSRIAFDALKDRRLNVFTVNSGGSRLRQLTDSRAASDAAWTSDGKRIVYSAPAGDDTSLFTVLADGGEVRRLTHAAGRDDYPSWRGSSDLTLSLAPHGKRPSAWGWIKRVGAR